MVKVLGSGHGRCWGGPEHVSTVRGAVLAVWLIHGILTPLPIFASFPTHVFEGYGIGRLLFASPLLVTLFTSSGALWAIKCGVILSCVVALVSQRWGRAAAVSGLVLVVLMDAITKALGGFANHAQTVPILAFGIVAGLPQRCWISLWHMRGCRASVSQTPRTPHTGALIAMWLVALTIVLPYTFVGMERIWVGGIQLFREDALIRYLAAASRGFQAYPSWMPVDDLQSILNAGFAGVTLFEAGSILLLWSRPFRVLWLWVMLAFHVSTLFLMNVLFWENIAIALAVFWWGWKHEATKVPSPLDLNTTAP